MNNTVPEEISAKLWSEVRPLLPSRPRATSKQYCRAIGAGRKPADLRKILSAILFLKRNRLAWRAAPKSFGSASTIHRYYDLWRNVGFFNHLRRPDLSEHCELKNFPWETLIESDQKVPATPHSMTELRAKKPGNLCPAREPANAAPASTEITEREPSLTDPRIQTRLLKLHGSTDVSSFWKATQSLLHDTVPHNAIIAYLDYLDHPKTWKAVRVLASPNARMPADWFEERWKLDITAPYIHSHRGIRFFKFSDIIQNSRELQRTEYFNQFFKPFGWHHTACLTFWHMDGISSAVALRRTKEQGDYRPGEMEFLKKVQPHLETVLCRLLPAHKDQAKLRWLVESAQTIPAALLFLDWDLQPLYMNAEAAAQCANWNFGPKEARAYNHRQVYRPPGEIAATCASLKSEWMRLHLADSRENTLSAKVLCSKDPRLAATISLTAANRETIFKPSFRITFELQSTGGSPLAGGRQDDLAWRLTAAERDLAQLASMGHSNSEIAARLSKSVNTVKHQLTSIYAKLGIDNPRKHYLSAFSNGKSSTQTGNARASRFAMSGTGVS